MTPRQKRMAWVGASVAGAGIAVALILTAFSSNLMYFYSPSEVAQGAAPTNRAFRLGGMVVKGSVERGQSDLAVRFKVTDFAAERTIRFRGILPDLFREGQGIVAIGQLDADGVFAASEVLAKHDEKYMPPEVASALKKGQAARPQAQ